MLNFWPFNRNTPAKVRNFDVGRYNRRLAAIPTATIAINSLIASFGSNVAARSRHICLNNPYAVSARNAFITALAGDGIRPVSTAKTEAAREAVKELWNDWVDAADADGMTNYYGLMARGAGELFEAGEYFIRFRKRRASDGLPVPFQLQLLPSEMLPRDDTRISSNRTRMGIEFDAIGNRVAYHFLRNHPGDTGVDLTASFGQTVRVPAEEVIHVFIPTQAGQIRGAPNTASALMRLAILDLYDDAELERKRTAALFAAFVGKPGVTEDEEEDHPLGGTLLRTSYGEPPQSQMTPGAIIDLLPGETVNFALPADVGNSYEAFQYRNLLAISAGLGVPYSIMTNDLRSVSYSSMREERVKFRQTIQAKQRNNIIPVACNPVWDRFIREATMAGLVPWTASDLMSDYKAFAGKTWILPRWPWVDPYKEQQAEVLAIDNKLKSRSESIQESGRDPDEVAERIKEDEERFASPNAPDPNAALDTGEETDPNATEDEENNDDETNE